MYYIAKKSAEKVTKKKLKITVKQWSVSFLVYRGRFAPLFSVFLIRRISVEWERVETGKAKCNGLGRFFGALNFVSFSLFMLFFCGRLVAFQE